MGPMTIVMIREDGEPDSLCDGISLDER
jgi:hypothetical protein